MADYTRSQTDTNFVLHITVIEATKITLTDHNFTTSCVRYSTGTRVCVLKTLEQGSLISGQLARDCHSETVCFLILSNHNFHNISLETGKANIYIATEFSQHMVKEQGEKPTLYVHKSFYACTHV